MPSAFPKNERGDETEGSVQAFMSAEDDLVRRFLPKGARRALEAALCRNLPGKDRPAESAFRLAQRKAQALAFQQREAVLRSDLFLDEALSFAGGDPV